MDVPDRPFLRGLPLGSALVAKLLRALEIDTLEMDPRLAPAGDGLLPQELISIAQAVDKRQRQYTAGRLLARKLLAGKGMNDFALISDEQRVPRWPEEWLGCITHTDQWCAVSLARRSQWRGLGIDVEPATELSTSLWDSIARADELAWVAQQPESQRGLLCKGLFSAKESIYKALYPEMRVFLGFDGMHIAFEQHTEFEFFWSATLQQDWASLSAGAQFTGGRMRIERGLLATAIALPR